MNQWDRRWPRAETRTNFQSLVRSIIDKTVEFLSRARYGRVGEEQVGVRDTATAYLRTNSAGGITTNYGAGGTCVVRVGWGEILDVVRVFGKRRPCLWVNTKGYLGAIALRPRQTEPKRISSVTDS